MKPHFKIFSAFVLLLSAACTPSDELAVRNKGLEIRWEQTAEGWKISRIADRKGRCWGVPDGAYTILFSSEKPSAEPETITNRGGDTMNFDIARFHYIAKDFNRAVSSVPMNRAGEALRFYPEKGWKEGRAVCFEARNELGSAGASCRAFSKATTSSPYSTSPTCTDRDCPTCRSYATTIRSPR